VSESVATPSAIMAENELAELIHDWAVRWVDGHDKSDRASCFSAEVARLMVEGGTCEFSELLVKTSKRQMVLVCSVCLKTWHEGHSCGRDQDGHWQG
jgi:hypothetical protein